MYDELGTPFCGVLPANTLSFPTVQPAEPDFALATSWLDNFYGAIIT